MEDLELALEVEPSHKDAANYLAQVLVVYGRQRMDGESLDASEAYFQRALKLNPWMEEAKDAMIELRARKLEKLKPKVNWGLQNAAALIVIGPADSPRVFDFSILSSGLEIGRRSRQESVGNAARARHFAGNHA